MAAAAPPPPPPSSSSQESGRGAGSGAPWSGGLLFAGSSERDVALSKSFWSSVTLQPPLESRLARRRESREPPASSAAGRKGSTGTAASSALSCAQRRSQLDLGSVLTQSSSFFGGKDEKPQKGFEPEPEITDEKRRYLEKAKTREEIIALLRKRREERIMKEMIAQQYKPKIKPEASRVKTPEPEDIDEEESVKALT